MDDEDFYALLRQAVNEGQRLVEKRKRRRPFDSEPCIAPLLRQVDVELRLRELQVRFAPAGEEGRR